MATSAEAITRLNAQGIIQGITGGRAITAASWSGGIATLTFADASFFTQGMPVYIYGVNPTGYNTTGSAVKILSVTATQITYALASDPGAYVSGGSANSQVVLGRLENPKGNAFFTKLLTNGAYCAVLPAENSEPWSGQTRHYGFTVKVELFYGNAQNTGNDFLTTEDSWTSIRNALMNKSNWAASSRAIKTPLNSFTCRGPVVRSDLTPQCDMYEF